MPEPMSVTPGSRLLWRPYRSTQLYFHESKKARALSTGDTEKVEKKISELWQTFLNCTEVFTFLRSHIAYG